MLTSHRLLGAGLSCSIPFLNVFSFANVFAFLQNAHLCMFHPLLSGEREALLPTALVPACLTRAIFARARRTPTLGSRASAAGIITLHQPLFTLRSNMHSFASADTGQCAAFALELLCSRLCYDQMCTISETEGLWDQLLQCFSYTA